MFPAVKNRLLKIGSLLQVLLVLLVCHGSQLTFHHCSADDHFFAVSNGVSALCTHCEVLGCSGVEDVNCSENQKDIQNFEPTCCCEDIDAENWVSNCYTFSISILFEKGFLSGLVTAQLSNHSIDLLHQVVAIVKKRYGPVAAFRVSGRQMLTFFSQMKLEPFFL